MKTLDRRRRVTQVFGRQPLRYLQDGHGFDAAERYLGRFNDQGEPLAAADSKGEAEAPSGTASLDEMSVKDLKAIAKEAGIEGAATMNKAALVEAITDATEPGDDAADSKGEAEGAA